ncbi:MAG: Spx/MgsR family RNA polymerase-binding regulatory protein [Oceanococcus sp.]
MITLYGIPNCDTVKRARQTLQLAGLDFQFHDFRRDGVELEQIQTWLEQLGDAVINRRGTTWRKLSDDEKQRAESSAATLLCEHPALIKRPVIDKDGDLRLGFAAKEADDIVQWLKTS